MVVLAQSGTLVSNGVVRRSTPLGLTRARILPGFPAYCRSSFGVFGAYWPIVNRAAMAVVWNGVNSVTGAQCIYVLLHSIFPSIAHIENKLSPSLALTSASMFCFFIFLFLLAVMVSLDLKKVRDGV